MTNLPERGVKAAKVGDHLISLVEEVTLDVDVCPPSVNLPTKSVKDPFGGSTVRVVGSSRDNIMATSVNRVGDIRRLMGSQIVP